MAALRPGQGVRDNVARFQLRAIIERATSGGYGPVRSPIILKRAVADLARLEA